MRFALEALPLFILCRILSTNITTPSILRYLYDICIYMHFGNNINVEVEISTYYPRIPYYLLLPLECSYTQYTAAIDMHKCMLY